MDSFPTFPKRCSSISTAGVHGPLVTPHENQVRVPACALGDVTTRRGPSLRPRVTHFPGGWLLWPVSVGSNGHRSAYLSPIRETGAASQHPPIHGDPGPRVETPPLLLFPVPQLSGSHRKQAASASGEHMRAGRRGSWAYLWGALSLGRATCASAHPDRRRSLRPRSPLH